MHSDFMMGVLHIHDIKEGMVLAADITNRHGNVLLKQGRTLSAKDILILKTWGVTEIDVAGVDRDKVEQKEMESLTPEVLEKIERELAGLFPEVAGNPIMQELYRIARKFKYREAITK